MIMANFGAVLHNLKLSKKGSHNMIITNYFLHKTAGTVIGKHILFL